MIANRLSGHIAHFFRLSTRWQSLEGGNSFFTFFTTNNYFCAIEICKMNSAPSKKWIILHTSVEFNLMARLGSVGNGPIFSFFSLYKKEYILPSQYSMFFRQAYVICVHDIWLFGWSPFFFCWRCIFTECSAISFVVLLCPIDVVPIYYVDFGLIQTLSIRIVVIFSSL